MYTCLPILTQVSQISRYLKSLFSPKTSGKQDVTVHFETT